MVVWSYAIDSHLTNFCVGCMNLHLTDMIAVARITRIQSVVDRSRAKKNQNQIY